ncbi:antitoxin HicB [Candidatus Kaiserbacteria bacterium RIFCSPHIGHO2_02_FULL_54_11b]|uniref:Antitoxin HicB n=2 Tax=Candidatus Kaiseribacteriota TaxID=1752734 RepID=A0A1F6CPK2_9BACT|nr:MAG: antitoxin HicB [Candidatus Kaiserbacteria bacterium RIFCSPHIGHO2_01_FULL_54_36b]OGG64251.1 MAG: antitoxin HicB [Candidatus Kaiserbacteria bacterium RIFCSPHIGHO2_02_FULL_54_11b]
MRKQTFKLVFEPDPAGGYTVTVPTFPGCVTYGANLEEARAMAREAISLYIEDMAADGEEIPKEDTSLMGTIEVDVAAA